MFGRVIMIPSKKRKEDSRKAVFLLSVRRWQSVNEVQPIRDRQTVKDIYQYLMERNPRNGIIYAMGIYTGLRISDILNLRIRDVRGRNNIVLYEQKTGKEKFIPINRFLKKVLEGYIEGRKDYEFLFLSPKPPNNHLSRQQVYNILSEAARHFGIEERIGTHTLRKTFGYHYYLKTHDVATLMKLFNHSSEEITLRYIGITNETLANVYKDIDLLG